MSTDYKSTEESRIIDKILDGNLNLYKNLVERYSPMVFHIVRKFVNDEDEVKELAQQIFIKTYEKLSSFRRDSKFSSWLYQLSKNHCRDYAKNIRRENIGLSELNFESVNSYKDENFTPHLQMEKKEWKDRLAKAMDALSAEYSGPFLMKYRDGMSYQTISEQTGVSVSALKVRVHRARKQLKGLLEKEV